MLGCSPCTLNTEKELNKPSELGDDAASDKTGASMGWVLVDIASGSERMNVVLGSADSARGFVAMFAVAALVAETRTFGS